MKIIFLAKRPEMALAMVRIVISAIQDSNAVLMECCSSKFSQPENLMDFEPDAIVMEPSSDQESNEVELMEFAGANKIPVFWLSHKDSPKVEKIFKALNWSDVREARPIIKAKGELLNLKDIKEAIETYKRL